VQDDSDDSDERRMDYDIDFGTDDAQVRAKKKAKQALAGGAYQDYDQEIEDEEEEEEESPGGVARTTTGLKRTKTTISPAERERLKK
jgi:hypothetical protein